MSSDGVSIRGYLIPERDLEEHFDTSGGPGGQHANRNETMVRLRFDIGASSLPEDIKQKLIGRIGPEVEVIAGDSRSQWRNRALARQRLGDKLEAAMVDHSERRPTKPSRSSKERRLSEKKARSDVKKGRKPPDLE